MSIIFLDNGEPLPGTSPVVEFTATSAFTNEGTLQFQVQARIVANGAGHAGCAIEFDVVPGLTTAQPITDYVVCSQSFGFAPGALTSVVEIDFPENSVVAMGGNPRLVLDLVSPAGCTIGLANRMTITIIDNDGMVPTDVDGDMLDFLGNPLAPPRRPFDETAEPHLVMHPDGVLVTPTGAANGGGTAGWKPLSGSGHENCWVQSMVLAAPIRQTLNTGAAALMGDEWEEVRIRCVNERGTPGVPGQMRLGSFDVNNGTESPGAYHTGRQLSVANAWPAQVDSVLPVVRDIIWYSGYPNELVRSNQWICWPERYRFDNIRLERIHHGRPAGNGTTAGYIWGYASLDIQGNPPLQGTIKLYDCYQGPLPVNASPRDYNGRTVQWAVKWDQRTTWDIRHREGGMPWPAVEDYHEHMFYLWAPSGRHVFANQVRPTVFANLRNGDQYPGTRTFSQLPSRPYLEDNSGHPPSGDVNWIRCTLKGHGQLQGGGGQSFTMWGLYGRTYVKDCVISQGVWNGTRNIGGVGVNPNPGWRGYHFYESPIGSQRYWAAREVVIDGLTMVGRLDPAWNPDHGKPRTPLAFRSVEIVRLVKFDLRGWRDHDVDMECNTNHFDDVTQSGDQYLPGHGFIGQLDISNLKYPDPQPGDSWAAGAAYTGDFNSYPGWSQNGAARVFDGTWSNWNPAIAAGRYGAGDAAFVNAYPGTVVPQLNANRLTGGQVTASGWKVGHFPAPGQWPPLPKVTWGAAHGKVREAGLGKPAGRARLVAFGNLYVGEGQGMVNADFWVDSWGSMNEIVVPFRVDGAAGVGSGGISLVTASPISLLFQPTTSFAPVPQAVPTPPFSQVPVPFEVPTGFDSLSTLGPYSARTSYPLTDQEPIPGYGGGSVLFAPQDGVVLNVAGAINPAGVPRKFVLRMDGGTVGQGPWWRQGVEAGLTQLPIGQFPALNVWVLPQSYWPGVRFASAGPTLTGGGVVQNIAIQREIRNGHAEGLRMNSTVRPSINVFNPGGPATSQVTIRFPAEFWGEPENETSNADLQVLIQNPTQGDVIQLRLAVGGPQLVNCVASTQAGAILVHEIRIV